MGRWKALPQNEDVLVVTQAEQKSDLSPSVPAFCWKELWESQISQRKEDLFLFQKAKLAHIYIPALTQLV